MKKQNLQYEKLDEIGRILLESARLHSEEIEKIIAAPLLFDSVKARIKTEQINHQKESISGKWRLVLDWQKFSFSFGFLAILFVSAIGFLLILSYQNLSPNALVERNVTAKIESIMTPGNISFDNSALPESGKDVSVDKQEKAQFVAFKKRLSKLPKPVRQTPFAKRPPKPEIENEGEFYAINFAGDMEDAQADAQIIRVELPRSSLYALGLNPPLENTNDRIKTELLIGSDGVTRGIRLAK